MDTYIELPLTVDFEIQHSKSLTIGFKGYFYVLKMFSTGVRDEK